MTEALLTSSAPALTTRKNTPSPDAPNDAHALRRAGGARREMTSRVTLSRGETELDGWVLNVSRGGLRVIVEDKVEAGEELGVKIGEEPKRMARIVWVQEEPDGSIIGMAFLDAPEGAAPPRQGSMPDIDVPAPPKTEAK